MTQTLPVPRVRITEAHRRGYAEALAASGSHASACQAVGVSRNSMRAHIEAHPDFAEQVEDAKAAFADSLLAEAKRRAVDGLAGELVLYEGEPVADPDRPGEFLRKPSRFSDRLLALMLEKVGPDAFRAPDRVVHEHKHSGEVRLVAPEILAAMAPAARIEAQRVILLADMRDRPDSEKQSAVLALSQEASRLGVEFDTLGTARALRIGKLAEPIEDAEFVEVPSDDIARQLRELEELV